MSGSKKNKTQIKEPPPPTKSAPKGLVFGRRLEDVLENQGNGALVPNIVKETITWLEKNNGLDIPLSPNAM